jgi:hypothetical protein
LFTGLGVTWTFWSKINRGSNMNMKLIWQKWVINKISKFLEGSNWKNH